MNLHRNPFHDEIETLKTLGSNRAGGECEAPTLEILFVSSQTFNVLQGLDEHSALKDIDIHPTDG